MITKTLNLDSAYTELFDDIREKSNGAIDINNVEGFFGNITAIKNLDKKYLRLPLDEPLFEIDANSRKIAVPDEFKANGLSVQGDHLAETVFFSIDRYFDYMDLGGTEVTINWKMGSETGKTDKFIMSADILPGSIVFGWPVNNVVTQKSGTLTFAVEFCKKDREGNVLYDFNTLAATISIKDGLVIGDVEAISLDNDILAILDDSQFGEGDAAVGPIAWLTGDGHGLVVGSGPDTAVELSAFAPEVDLRTTITEGVPQSVPANLYAQAFVDNGTEVKYMDSVGTTITPVMSEVVVDLVEADSIEEGKVYRDEFGEVIADPEEAEELFVYDDLDDSLVYYVQVDGSNPVAYRVASAADLATWNTANQVDLYVKLAKITVSDAGSYIIKAQGQKFDNEGHKIGAGATASSEPVVVPSVEAPSEIAIEKSEAPVVDNPAYSFDEEASANVVFLGNEGASLTASAVVDSFGALQFVWKKKIGDAANFSDVAAETPAYKLENEDVLNITEAGEYKVAVRNFKNSAYAQSVESEVFIASPLAGAITAAQVQSKLGSGVYENVNGVVQYNSNGSLAQKTISLRVGSVTVDGQTGVLSYQWYVQTGIGEEATRELISENAELTITSGDGRFIPVVKNNYNGSIFTYELEPVTVDDIA